MAFARQRTIGTVLRLLHLALAIWALTTVVAAVADDQLASPVESAAEPAPENRFDVWEYRVEGNSLLDARRIEAAVYPQLGPRRAVTDVNEAAANLERAYRDAGYPTIYVDVPEQDVKGGVVMLRVVEGKIGRVRVEGARYFTPDGIRAQLTSVAPGQALHVPSMQAELNAVNAQSTDLKVVPVLKPGKTPGVVDIDLKVKDSSPLHGSLDINNYNSINTTESRVAASLSYDNLWQKQHSLALQYQVSPQNTDEVSVIAATYIAPWFDSGNRFAVYAIDSKSDVASLGDVSVIGNGKIYGARFVMPFPSDRQLVHSMSLGADYKDYSEIIRLDPANSLDTPIDYAVWSVQYNATQFAKAAQTQWGMGANFGIRGVGNSDEEFVDKRNKSYANFAYLRASMERTDLLPADWQLLTTLRGQISDSPLINNEQFSIGGSRSVRGYYESQALGDNGYTGGLELRTPKLVDSVAAIDDLRLLSFIEGGRLTIRDPLPDQEDSTSLLGAGVGLMLQTWSSLDLAVDVAYALKDNGTIDQGDKRINADLQWKF